MPPLPPLSLKKQRRLERESEKLTREKERSARGSSGSNNREFVRYSTEVEDYNGGRSSSRVDTRFGSSHSSSKSIEVEGSNGRKRSREIVTEEVHRINTKVSSNGSGGRLVTTVLTPLDALHAKMQYRKNYN